MRFALPIMGFFIAAGLALGGYFISETMLKQSTGANTATVKGLSERIVPADSAYMTVAFRNDLTLGEPVASAFERSRAQRAQVTAALASAGVADTEIAHNPLEIRTDVFYDRDGIQVGKQDYVWSYSTVASRTPGKLAQATGPLMELATQGIRPQIEGPYYDFSSLNDIKPDMLREATDNARIAANEFASNAGIKVGGIQVATQGGFQVESLTPRPGLVEPGQHLVRVVTTITFYLEN